MTAQTEASLRFEAEIRAAGLRGDWQKDDDDRYTLSTAWWQSFAVTGEDPDWAVWEFDHDAGIGEDGRLYTSGDAWDEHFLTWIEAAREVEERRLPRSQ